MLFISNVCLPPVCVCVCVSVRLTVSSKYRCVPERESISLSFFIEKSGALFFSKIWVGHQCSVQKKERKKTNNKWPTEYFLCMVNRQPWIGDKWHTFVITSQTTWKYWQNFNWNNFNFTRFWRVFFFVLENFPLAHSTLRRRSIWQCTK